jgi:subtilase family serine protease
LYRLGYEGRGKVVAIVVASATPTLARGLAVFSRANHLPPLSHTLLYPDGNPGYVPSWFEETTMDRKLVHALAPHAHVVLVVSPNLLAGFQYIVTHHVAPIVSFSAVLGTESSHPKAYGVHLDALLKAAAQSGITILKGAGERGAFSRTTHPTLYFPPDSPWVTAIGGVTLLVSPGANTSASRSGDIPPPKDLSARAAAKARCFPSQLGKMAPLSRMTGRATHRT